MKKITTINTVLVFLVIIGTVFANVNAIVSIMPINIVERDVKRVDNKTTITDINEFDVKTLTEIANYISIQAAQNNFEVSAMVYSSGLLFESDDSLVIIGHGHFSSNNQYFIADYSENSIHEMTKDKETVALLSCYSSNIELANERQLTYEDQIDLVTAMNDLSTILQWEKATLFSPYTNVQLFYLDPGDGGGLDPNLAPTRFMNGVKIARSRSTYWNLNYESAVGSLTNYMLRNNGIRVEFSFSTTFYEELSSGNWELKFHTATYDAWSFIDCDMKTYIKITNIKIDGVSKNKEISLSVDELMIAVSQDGKNGFLGTMQMLAGIFAGLAGLFITGFISIKIAIALGATAAALGGLAYLCTCLIVIFGFLTLYTIIVCAILSLVWI